MKNKWIVRLLVALVAGFIHFELYSSDFGQRFEPSALDIWFNIRGEIQPPEDVILIAIDEDSYQELELPMDKAWPRAVHARLLRRLAAAGIKRVVFDVAFIGESDNPKADKELAAALAGLESYIGADSGTSVGQFKIEQVLLPLDMLAEAATGVALVGLPEDAGIVRRFKSERTGRTKKYLTLSEAGAGIDREKDLLPGERDFIWYYGGAGRIPTYSYFEVLDPELIPDQELLGKIAYVGLLLRTEVGPAQKDSYMTPFWQRGRMFGVEIHATAAGNLKNKIWIKRFSEWGEALTLSVLAILLSLMLLTIRPGWGGLALFCMAIAWSALSFTFFLKGIFLPGTVLVVLLLPVVYLASTLHYYFITNKAQRQTQRAFEMYLSPEMAREVGNDPKLLSLGGEGLYATAMFTDIVGFTKITETMTAEQTAEMLNAYFTEVMEVIFEKSGTLIKFIGDAVFAVWGAPVKISDHAQKAAETALLIQQGVREFNASGRFPALHTKVGVHTGPMVVGNLGSVRRFDYTAIGDAVNLSSRIEGLNKYYGTSILLTEATKKEVRGDFNVLSMGLVNVVGKSETIEIFSLFEESITESVRDKWLSGLAEFRIKAFDEAINYFQQAAQRDERLQIACELFCEHANYYKQNPPSKEWKGEIIHESK